MAVLPADHQIAFGPVPSRRLGQSLGINNVPRKHCTLSCVYCQLGRTPSPESRPRSFFAPESIRDSVAAHVGRLRQRGEVIDYLSFVPDGEPTLDEGLGRAIELLRPLGIPIAVISNGTLLGLAEVRAALARADWVSLKVDGGTEETWRRMNRPAPGIDYAGMVAGMKRFAREFSGHLMTETMVIHRANDSEEDLRATRALVASLAPETALLNTPVRPSADPTHRPPPRAILLAAERIFTGAAARIEAIGRAEAGEFASTGDFEADVLGITAVHPMREDELRAFAAKCNASWERVESLLARRAMSEIEHNGERFYVRASDTGT